MSPLARFNRRYLARESGINIHTLGKIIRGDRKATKTELIALSAVTGLTFEYLSSAVENREKAS